MITKPKKKKVPIRSLITKPRKKKVLKRNPSKEITAKDPRVQKLLGKIHDCNEAIDEHKEHIAQISENLEMIRDEKRKYVKALDELGFDYYL